MNIHPVHTTAVQGFNVGYGLLQRDHIFLLAQIYCFQLLRMLQISFQPFRSLFCKIPNLNADSFQFSRLLLQSSNLSGDGDIRKVCIDGFYNLVIVISQFLKLEIKVVQPCDELRLRRVASGDYELLAEDSFDDKTAAVMLQSGFAEQLVEEEILLLFEPERVLVTRNFRLSVIPVSLFPVGIHNIG